MPMSEPTFYRPVRNYPEPLPSSAFQIEPPPPLPQQPTGFAAIVQYLYPLAGVLMTVVMVGSTFSFSHGAISPLIIIAEICIIPLSIGLMILQQFLQRRMTKKQQKQQQAMYREYLASMQRRLTEIAKLQSLRNTRLYPDPMRLPAIVSQRQPILWERRPLDDDFLAVRVGLAPTALCCPVTCQEDYKIQYIPDLLQEVRDLVTRNSHIDAQPMVIPLRSLGALSVLGPRASSRALMRAILAQIMTFHAPSEVRVAAYFPPDAAAEWGWLKWMPHARRLRKVKLEDPNEPDPLCLLADNVFDFQQILEMQLMPELEQRHKLADEKRLLGGSRESEQAALARKIPHIICILDGFTPRMFDRVPGLEELLRDAAAMGVTVLCLVDTPEQEPALISGRLALTSFAGGSLLSYKETAAGGQEIEFITPDSAPPQMCEEMARSLAPLKLIDKGAGVDFSRDIGLLALHEIEDVDHLRIEQHWRGRDERQILRVPIGLQQGGPLMLDLKEMAVGGYGPHGLVVGATGSGKSELLRTVVTSLALTHDPFTINFVLVDFKAGAAFADFEGLPHVAGIITNLENDPQLIARMHASLLGEQQRRQGMLARAGNLANIRQYQAKWRKNPLGMEPMPYLLIIVDEFAQLIANYEEFLALFVKFGQVGRSLGMHMMLATQRIDEGRISSLEGHLRYRICLRTFKPEESNAVIGSADAYYLPPLPGSGYFKVDEDIYNSFKTALISTPYIPPEERQVDPLTLFSAYTYTGKLIPCEPQMSNGRHASGVEQEQRTEMNVVIERIRQAPTPPGGWRVHAVWQPPLGEMIPLGEVLARCDLADLDGTRWPSRPPLDELHTPIGMLDRPATQQQEPVILDFSGLGGHLAIVGAPQSGKSTLLRTLLASFIVTHTPRDVQIYGIDFGGGLLRVFEDAPHVGAICNRSDKDKIRRVLRRLKQLIVEREALFAARDIDSMTTYREMRRRGLLTDQEFGDAFLVIDNYGQLYADFEMSDPDITADIGGLIANGLTYGVHVVLAVNLWMEIRPKLRSNIGMRLELRQNDPGDSEIDRKLAATIPPDTPGRGLHPEKLLFQVAVPVVWRKGTRMVSTQQALEDLVQRAAESWQEPGAPRILVLPPEVRIEELPAASQGEPKGVPIGLEEFRLSPQYIDLVNTDPHFIALGDKEAGKTTLLRTWIRGLQQRYTPEQAQIVLVDVRRGLLEFNRSPHMLAYAYTTEKVKEAVAQIKDELAKRVEANLSQPIELLRNPQPWSGLHYYIFLDDYEEIAGPMPQSGNPLNELEGFLQSGREIGFHIVLARRLTDFARSNYDPIFRGIKTMECPGLLMRGDPAEGRQALHKMTVSDKLPNGRGYLVRRGYPPTLVQVAKSEG